MDAGHVGQFLLVVSCGCRVLKEWRAGGIRHVIHFLAVCSLNSRDAFSGFGDRLSAILNLAN